MNTGQRHITVLTYAQRVRDVLVELRQFDDLSMAMTWIDTPQPMLGGQRPAALLLTDEGTREVRALILRLRG